MSRNPRVSGDELIRALERAGIEPHRGQIRGDVNDQRFTGYPFQNLSVHHVGRHARDHAAAVPRARRPWGTASAAETWPASPNTANAIAQATIWNPRMFTLPLKRERT